MPNEPAAPDVEALIEYHKRDCNRYTNRSCQTLRCLKRGGWTKEAAAVYATATCEQHETITALRAQHAEIERMRGETHATENALAAFMMGRSFTTGHGESLVDLLAELGWQIDELRARMPPPPAPNTVPVRIALTVGADGKWYGRGVSDEAADAQWVTSILGNMTKAVSHVVFITADAPLPEAPKEIKGRVEP